MEPMLSLMNDMRLRNKMFFVYFVSVFAPLLLTNVIFYQVITNNVKTQRLDDIERAVEQIRNDFRSQIDEAVGLSAFYYADYNTNEILERDFANPESYIEAYDSYLRRTLGNYSPGFLSLQSVTIYADNLSLLHSGNIGYLSDDIRSTSWYKAAVSSKRSQPVFTRIESMDGDFATFSLIRKLNYFSDQMQKEKLLRIDFKTIDLESIFANLNMEGDMYLLNPEGEIEYTTNTNVNWIEHRKTRFSSLSSKDSIEFVKEYRGISYLDGWRIVGTINEDEVVQEVQKSRSFIWWSACMMMVVPTAFILLMTKSINQRIVQILKHMKKVKSQNFEMIGQPESKDEIGQLTLEFNQMILQVKSLIQDVYLADIRTKSMELERRKAQLNALQSQINPHFLFNALETIRMRSMLKNEEETAAIIHSMAKVFRSSLTWNRDRVSVNEELGFIQCFLDIQKYRFEEKLNFSLDIAAETRSVEVPKMVFLPFVENACIHGIEPLKRGGKIDIRINADESEIVFTIRDNGVGMEQEKVASWYRFLELEEVMGERIGVQNVIYRAKMIYGDKFRFKAASELGKGTLVEIRLPRDSTQNYNL
ncbi:sensor histidine kinase [Paenibacillus sp. LHD-117]|uniref:sensor histidine kinase n=1 Tax=Paenibacillus sp. LHD-117 TaxID=3071412 RepID=UPI0027DF58A4|nr:sensor histidine kinase [Paenibacillus sp. LHD-117]MDQ6417854.1 sensor histidine kinase [Paenibacillus sp. LHD-117]